MVTCSKIKCFQIGYSLQDTHNTSWLAPHNHMLPPKLPTSRTKIKHDNARWITLLIMEDVGCNLTFAKVMTNTNIIKAVAKSPCITPCTELEQLYHRLGAKKRCLIKEADRISLMYLTSSSNYQNLLLKFQNATVRYFFF
jgi:hypothetical protein